MKKLGLGLMTILMAFVLLCQGALPAALAEGDVILNELTAQSIFDGLGDALNYGTVAREWEQNAHAETSACVDDLDRYTNTVFANTGSTYFHALPYDLELDISAPGSVQGMEFALYTFDGETYTRVEGTEKTVTENTNRATVTWEIGNELKNTRLYVLQTNGDGYVEPGAENAEGFLVECGPSLSSSAHNNNYIGKIITHTTFGLGDSMGIFNTFDYSPSLTFGPETRLYYSQWNKETQQNDYIEIDPEKDTDLYVQNVLVNYYYSSNANYDPATDEDTLVMGYTKLDDMSYLNGSLVRNGNKYIGIEYMEEGGYADKLLDNAEKYSKKIANMGGGEITSLTPDPTGGSTVTGPVVDGTVVSLYDVEIGADGVFRVKDDMGWDGIPVAENEYVIVNLICPSKDGTVQMGTDSSDITYFYKEGQGRGEAVSWGSEDSNSSQRVIYNFVYADENGMLQPFEGTIHPTSRHGGTLLAPKAYVELVKEVHNGAIIADKVYNGQEIHQRNLAPLARVTTITMDGGYITLNKISAAWVANGMYGGWEAEGPLADAVFGVYSDQACTNLETTMTTGKDGTATSKLLPAGTYYVKEIEAPDGYAIQTDWWGNATVATVTVAAGETTTAKGPGLNNGWGVMEGTEDKFVNTQSNEEKGNLRIEKLVAETGKPLQGAVFGIYLDQRCTQLVATMKTNRYGMAFYEGLTIRYDYYGTQLPYYIKEIEAPAGYKIDNNNVITQYLGADKTYDVDGNGDAEGYAFTNSIIRGNMALKKTDAVTGRDLAGAEFTIYSDKNCTEVVGVMTTKRGGDADSKRVIEGKDGLIPGTYYVVETKAPAGYILPDPAKVYTVEVLSGKMVDVVTGSVITGAPDATAITNTEGFNIAGKKTWLDDGAEGSRPQSITVNLLRNGEFLKSVKTGANDNWAFTFENLPKFDTDGKEYTYTVKEDMPGYSHQYYSYVTQEEKDGTLNVTISNSVRKTRVTGTKVWEDTVQYDPDKPDSITFLLYQKVNGELVPVLDGNGNQMSATGGAYNSYAFEFRDLPTYDATGKLAEYAVEEAESDKYILIDSASTSKTEGGNTVVEFTLTNRLTVPLAGTKVWQDSSNADGKRPENVTLEVLCNGTLMNPQPTIDWDKTTDTDNWSWSVSGLPKYDANNNVNTYTVQERAVPGYNTTYSDDGLTIYNSKPGSIRLYKIYVDGNGNNQPLNGAEFKLYWDEACNNPVSDTVYVTADNGPTRRGFIEIANLTPGDYYIREEKAPAGFALPVPNDPIKVTVIAGQTARVNGDHGVVINLSEDEALTITVTKAWAGDADQTDARPKSVTVQLYQNDTAMSGKTMELTADNNWYGEFDKLPLKDANGNAYTYTVKETAVVPGYLSTVTGSLEDGFTITNTYNLIDIPVSKVWVGVTSDADKSAVTVQLYQNGTPMSGMTAELNAANSWSATFTQLPKKDTDGNAYTYTVEETKVPEGFTVTYSGDQNGFTVTNSVQGGYITLKKIDGDNNNALSGAVFGVYTDKACTDKVTEMTTGSDGTATSSVLKAGTYYVKEMQAPSGYQIVEKDAVEVTVVADQTVTAKGSGSNGEFINLQRVKVYINKVTAEKNEWGQFQADTAKPLAGAEFTIYSDSGCSQVVTVMITDENGYAEALLMAGKQYWVKETKAPAGYEIVVKDTYNFWANLGDPMRLTWGNWDQNVNGAMVNTKTEGGAITLTKADAADSSKMLSGAVFGVYSDSGCNTLAARMPATDANGVSTLDFIGVGTYYVKEITAPEGYELSETVYTVEVKANDTAKVNEGKAIENSQLDLSVEVQLAAKKTLNGSSNVPSGYYFFQLYEDKNGTRTQVGENQPNEGGDVLFPVITYTEEGTYSYIIKEVKGTDETVVYDETEHTATVTVQQGTDGQLTATVNYDKTGTAQPPVFNNTKNSVNVTVTKKWNHDGNAYTNNWPSNAEVQLVIDGELQYGGNGVQKLDNNNNWTYTWRNLPQYRLEDGKQVEIVYEVIERQTSQDYSAKVEKDETAEENTFAYKVTNTYIKKDQKQELTLPVTKVIEGGETDETFTFRLEARNSAPPAPMPEGAQKTDYGTSYVTAETTGSKNGTKIYFDTIEITAEKVMNDCPYAPYQVTYGWEIREVIPEEKAAGIVYDEGWYEIYASYAINEEGELVLAQRDVWDENWENIIGTEPDVTIYHYTADGDMSEVDYNNGNPDIRFVNEMTLTSVSVIKQWPAGDHGQDLSNQLTLHTLKNGVVSDALTGYSVKRSEDGNTYTWFQLPKQDEEGNEIQYVVKEAALEGYDTVYPQGRDGYAMDGDTIINNAKTYALTLEKTDKTDSDKKLAGATYGVYDNEACEGEPVYTITTGEDGTGTLDKVAAGTYYVKEITAPEGYDLDPNAYPVTVPNGEDASKPVFVPVADYPLTKVSVTKVWEGITANTILPASITVQLQADGMDVEGKTLTLTADNGWAGEFADLPAYDVNADQQIVYTIRELTVEHFTTAIEAEGDNSFTITNTYSAEGEITFGGTKTLTGRELKAEEFSFVLSDATGEVETVGNAADGSFSFSTIKYTLADVGEHTYTVKELNDGTAGIVYDATEYEIIVTVADNGDGTLNVTASDNAKTIAFVNAYETEGSLTLTAKKTLSGRTLEDGQFSFELSGEGVSQTKTNNDGGVITFDALTYDEADIGKTYTYTVKESSEGGNGYTVDNTVYEVVVSITDDGSGKLQIAYTVDGEANKQMTFANTYEAAGEITFSGTKTLTGRELKAEEFSFVLSDATGEVETVVNAADGSFAFSTIKYTLEDVGEHTYTVQEVAGEDKEITYDETVYEIKVTVSDNGDGTLKVEADKDEAALDFVNEYEEETTSVTVTKVWDDNEDEYGLRPESIRVILLAQNTPQLPYVVLSAENGWTHTWVDLPVYAGSSDIVYTVREETVTGYKGQMSGNAADGFVITNTVDYNAEGEWSLLAEKQLNGRTFKAGDSFTFTLSGTTGAPMPEQAVVTIQPETGTAAKVDFGKIFFTEQNIGKTYIYTVQEKIGSIEGITYDDRYHTVTVTVQNGGDGTLIITPEYADGEQVILTNIYNASGEWTLDVEKTIKGRSFLPGDSFTFTVEGEGNAPLPEKTEVVIEPTSGSNAKVDFGKIAYGLDDAGKTFTYTVKEKAGDRSGLTYDTTAYTVTVTVEDDGMGGLQVTPVYQNGSRVTFVNTYAAAGTYQLTAKKILTGKELADKQFTFVLKNEQGMEIETATNDAQGMIAFRAFNFSQNDIGKTFTYYVSERNAMKEGYIYDTTVYTVTLTVQDNGDGTLTVEASGIPADGMIFENIFDNNTAIMFRKKWQGKEGPAITLTLYANGVKMDPQPQYVKNGNVYSYENLPRFDENEKEIVYSAKESYMDGYLTIYENNAPYQDVTDQVVAGGTIINRSVTDFAVRKEWQGLGKNEEAPAIELTLYCNGQPMDHPTPTPDADGWYTYHNLPGVVDGKDAVYTVVETELEGFTTIYSGEEDCALNGETIVNRKIPQTGDTSSICLWITAAITAAGALVLMMKKRRHLG